MSWLSAIGWGFVWLIGIAYLWVLFIGATSAMEILERQKRRRRLKLNVVPTPGNEGTDEETGA